MYKTFRPHPLLAAYVDAYWISEATGSEQVRILPDTCADIIFNIGEDTIVMDGLEENLAPGAAFVVGTMTTFRDVVAAPGTIMLGIRFKPGGLHAFTRVPMQQLTDQHLMLPAMEATWQQQLAFLPESNTTLPEKISKIEHFLLERLPATGAVAGSIQQGLSLITRQKGNIAVATLGEQTYMSQRSFERHFLQAVGISPKTFACIIRFINIRRQLKAGVGERFLSLALGNGYYDHAHLTREFREFSGESPSSYQQR
ncbi:helix-turn-helix domain-containing protein [Chitinophaga sp. 212800010-3]|uniref:AraC family transcriptional regulator n=1 Tax=unclassified Chitinophaga TaxID=2619133 RepID=UPI002DF0504F|nr:AraC-type DNA-binding protein [Chitinophaga sp. 212800010-3]